MSKWYYCWECDDFFEEEDAKKRMAVEEDDVPRGTWVMCCPNCEGGQIEPVEVCKRCGQPLEPIYEDFCPDCERELYKAVEALICDEVLTTEFPGDYLDAKQTFFEYLERRWF